MIIIIPLVVLLFFNITYLFVTLASLRDDQNPNNYVYDYLYAYFAWFNLFLVILNRVLIRITLIFFELSDILHANLKMNLKMNLKRF